MKKNIIICLMLFYIFLSVACSVKKSNEVTFEPRARSNCHIHDGGQILIATDGIGFHQIEGQDVEILKPGDVAFCPPGVMHWHGGSIGNKFAH